MEIHLKISKKLFALIVVLFIGFSLFFVKTQISSAEQSGSSPESGSNSRMKTIYDVLVSAGYGSDSDTPDWGANWNRIKTAANWVPTGDAVATDVRSGKTFFNTSRSVQTGTMIAATPCSTQQYYDSHPSANVSNNCNLGWITYGYPVDGDDKQDPRTGLVWSQGLKNNAGSVEFTTSPLTTWTWTAAGSNNIEVGNKTAAEICTDRGNGWRLPTQKELFQAYVDGAYYNLSNTGSYFWSQTYTNTTANYYALTFSTGYGGTYVGTTNQSIRCVRQP